MGESTRDAPPHSLSILGTLSGALLLIYLNIPLLKLLTGAVIIPFAIILLLNIKIKLNSQLSRSRLGYSMASSAAQPQ